VLVAFNMSGQQQTVQYDVGKEGSVLIASPLVKGTTIDLKKMVLPAFGVVVVEVR
jgi:hypothetical protein